MCYPLDWIDINLVNSVIHLFNNWGQELIKDLSEFSAHALGRFVMATEACSVSLLLASTLSWITNSGFFLVLTTALLKSSSLGTDRQFYRSKLPY